MQYVVQHFSHVQSLNVVCEFLIFGRRISHLHVLPMCLNFVCLQAANVLRVNSMHADTLVDVRRIQCNSDG